jgi:hypothetical protein
MRSAPQPGVFSVQPEGPHLAFRGLLYIYALWNTPTLRTI